MVEAVGDVTNPAPPEVTYRSVLKHDNVKILAASRAAAKMAGSTLSYGAMVYLAQIGSSQIQISSVSAAQYLAASSSDCRAGSWRTVFPNALRF